MTPHFWHTGVNKILTFELWPPCKRRHLRSQPLKHSTDDFVFFFVGCKYLAGRIGQYSVIDIMDPQYVTCLNCAKETFMDEWGYKLELASIVTRAQQCAALCSGRPSYMLVYGSLPNILIANCDRLKHRKFQYAHWTILNPMIFVIFSRIWPFCPPYFTLNTWAQSLDKLKEDF